MTFTLSDEARQLAVLFEDETDATVRDCLVDEDRDRVVFLIKTGEMGQAIGTDGKTIEIARELARRHYDVEDIQLT